MAVLPGEISTTNGYRLEANCKVDFGTIAYSGYPASLHSLLQTYSMSALGYFTDCLAVSSFFQQFNLSIYHDYQSSLRRFFGAKAYQDNQYLYIFLSDLSIQNTVNPTAEGLFVALLQHVQKYESNSLLSNVYIELFGVTFEKDNNYKIIFNLLIKLYLKIDYSSETFALFDKLMVNYSSIISADDFDY